MSSDSRQKSSQMPPNEGPSLYEAPMRTPSRRLKVVVIGAGMACIEFLYKAYNVYHLGEYVDFTVFEANEDVGGTWLVNRYPGVACDIAAHVYTFSFAPNPEWSSFYASGSEIWRYIKKTVDRYNLARDMKFKHRVTAADFDESKGQWDLQIENHEGHLFTEHCNILISATGFLSRWKWPQIDGLHSFQGGAPVMHSASWDEEYDFTGKRIAVIGNGSSGIQIVPEMAKVGSKVVNFARSGTWILAGLGNRMIDGRANYIYSEEEKHRFREDIDALKAYRKEIQQQSFASFSIFVKDSEMQTQAVDATKKLMLTKLNNYDDLAAKLIPNWPIGCRRATPGLDYLEALTQPHVSLVQEPIQRVTEHGITTVDGLSREFDVIICATGFDVSYRPGFPLRGRDGVDLAEKWKEAATTTTAAAAETGPLAYLSICVPGFPNYFMFTGPNAPVGHGALMAGLGWTAEYIAKWIVKLAEEDIKWVEVKEDATQEFNAYADQIMQTLVWSSPCKSWYKNSNNDDDNHNNAEGRVTALWAGSGLGFREMVSSLRPEDFVIRYHSSNRFRFMGNGRVKQEFQPGADLAWFMD